MSTLALQATDDKTDYHISLSYVGTARITWDDGTGITLVRQQSKAQALRTALAMRQAQTVQDNQESPHTWRPYVSYRIAIGEATISYELRDPTEVDILARALVLSVPTIHHADAPVFPGDSMTGDSNSRHAGYLQWHTFTKEASMWALWSEILRVHPGIVLLTEAHLRAFLHARDVGAQQALGVPPGWCVCAACSAWDEVPCVHTVLNNNLARLEWLVWWSQWALAHCRIPAIANS